MGWGGEGKGGRRGEVGREDEVKRYEVGREGEVRRGGLRMEKGWDGKGRRRGNKRIMKREGNGIV